MAAKTFNKYTTNAAYIADTERAALTKSNLSYVVETDTVYKAGKNILRDISNAQKGDALVYSKILGKLVCITGDSYDATNLSSDFIDHKIVCVGDREDDVFFAPKDVQASQTYGYPDVWKLEGFDLTNGGTFTLVLKGGDASSSSYISTSTVTYSAGATVSGILSQITFPSSCVSASVVGNYIRIQITGWSTSCTVTITTSGSETVTMINPYRYQMGFNPTGMSVISNIIRNKGLSTWYAGSNFPGFKNYYAANGATTQNLDVNSDSILRESAFNATDNPTLYTKYNGDYDAYIESEMVKWPHNTGTMRNWNGVADTEILNSYTFTDIDASSTVRYGFPAGHAAKVFGYTDSGYTTGLEAGNWHLPDVNAMYLALKDIDCGNWTDILSKTIIKMGGNAHQVRSYNRWTSSLYSGVYAWYWTPACRLSDDCRITSFTVWPFLALKKS